MPLIRNAVTLRRCQAPRSSRTTMATFVSKSVTARAGRTLASAAAALVLLPRAAPARVVAAGRPGDGPVGPPQLGGEAAARRAGVRVEPVLGRPRRELLDAERRDARTLSGLLEDGPQVALDAPGVRDGVVEVLGE